MRDVLTSYYRLPQDWERRASSEVEVGARGSFPFGSKTVFYGRSNGVASEPAKSNVLKTIHSDAAALQLPFDLSFVIENLRFENYTNHFASYSPTLAQAVCRNAYYSVREFLPVTVRRCLQRLYFSGWKDLPFPSWPVDFTVDNLHEEYLRLLMQAGGVSRVPFIWFWPNAASSALILTHDVETAAGRDSTASLMDLDASHQFKASIQVVPEERYEVPESYALEIRSRGFEFNVHDLNHDGRLYQNRTEFLRRAEKINAYVRHYGAHGFRSGAMYRNLSWYDAFEFSYDMSAPNVAHLEPQRGGCCTVMPYFVGKILEIPLTTSQDYSVFHILNDYSMDLWKQQIELIHKRHGLLSFIAHPDYLIDLRARRVYVELLEYLRRMIDDCNLWATIPCEVDKWWRARNQMKLVSSGDQWTIEGPEKERATIAYAVLDKGHLRYEPARVTQIERAASLIPTMNAVIPPSA